MTNTKNIHHTKNIRQFVIGSDTSTAYTMNHVRTSRYTKYNFIPNATIIQFRRMANVYFLILGILQCIDALSSLSDKSSIAPFIIVIALSVLREGIEDIPRQKTDTKVNSSIAIELCKDGQYKEVKWRDIKVGDVLLVKDGEEFPADLVLLKAAHENGSAFIETANLDGEKNLKPKYALPETAAFFDGQTLKRKELYQCTISAQAPDPSFYRFEGGFVSDQGNKAVLGPKQLMVRGSKLKSVEWILGAVVYAGHDTKLMRNAEKAKTKVSRLESLANKFIIGLLMVQAMFCVIAAVANRVFNQSHIPDHWYIPIIGGKDLEAFLVFLSYYILMYAMIPIALIITMEIVKVIQAQLIQCDEDMFSADKEKGAKVFCSSINEELGLVDYVFSDKTGTLTSNEMVFKRFVIGNESYGKEKLGRKLSSIDLDADGRDNDNTANVVKPDEQEEKPEEDELAHLKNSFANTRLQRLFDLEEADDINFALLDKSGKEALRFKTQKELATEYMQAVATCHECIVEKNKEGVMVFQGQSQDEVRLVETANDVGFRFIGGNREQIQVDCLGKVKEIKLLHIFEFNSDRKRMSTLVRDGTMIKLYTKGADNVILDRLRKGVEQPSLEFTNKKLDHYSQRGYRTLVYAMRVVSEEEYIKLKGKLDDVAADEHREEKLAHIADEFEKDLYLMGCTAVEDKLQDNVPQVIHDLLRANIKVWILTGDKLETAENIAHSCKLITGDMNVLRLVGRNPKQVQAKLHQCKEEYDLCITEKRKKALIVEGEALGYILHDKLMEEQLIQIVLHCDSVVVCRATPRQKAEMVRIVKDRTGKVTLAIGDGANDVNMIQAANIGVGIYGHEGVQAVQASDFAIPEFQCLWKLIIVHGRWCYLRIAEMIFYFFYKSLLFCIPQFYFAFVNGYSSQTLYDDYYFNFYDLIFTSLPIGARAAAEKDLDYRIRLPRKQCTSEKIFVVDHKIKNQMPLVYAENKGKPIFTVPNLIYWNMKAALMGVLLFTFAMYGVGDNIINDTGIQGSLWFDSITLYTGVVVIVSVSIIVQTKYWNIVFFCFLGILSLGIYFAFTVIYGLLDFSNSSRTYGMLYQSILFYAYIVFFIGLELLIDLTKEGVRKTYWPTLADDLRDQMKKDEQR